VSMLMVPAEQYHADELGAPMPCLSSSIAKILLARSPLHAWAAHPKLGNLPREKGEDDKFDYGSACHDVLLEGGAKLVILNPEDYRSKPTKADPEGSVPKGWTNGAIREARAAAQAEGKLPLLPSQGNRVMKMVEGARKFIQEAPWRDAWAGAQKEATFTWQEKGVWLKVRFDAVSLKYGFIGDYKSTVSANPRWFSGHMVRMGYHFQQAFYERALKAQGIDDPLFMFLAQEVSAPHACSWHTSDADLRKIANAEIDRAILLWAECLAENRWPSYGQEPTEAKPTSWMMEQAMEEGIFDLGYRETVDEPV
jgi:hypothetical protein